MFNSQPQELVQTVPMGVTELDNGMFVQLPPTPESGIAGFVATPELARSATPEPEKTQETIETVPPRSATPTRYINGVYEQATYQAHIMATATRIMAIADGADYQSSFNQSYEVGLTPASGRWVYGWYADAYCPTGYTCTCNTQTCLMMVPDDLNCQLQNCNYRNNQNEN